jgi:predicted amidohydrolase
MLIRNATLPDGRTGVDVLALDGRIAAVGPALPAPPGIEVVDAGGLLLSPPFSVASMWKCASTPAARCWKASHCGASSSPT